MSHVLILNGSPHGKNGNTSKLVELFMSGYQSESPNDLIDYVELRKSDIHQCVGCFSCWTKTPGECIFKDHMPDLIEKFREADLIIWATPLYHHGMTTLLKGFVERTLPFNLPYIVNEDGHFTHPERFTMKDKKHVIISNCGFPERKNFDIMLQTFDRVTHNEISETILCVMGELISKKPLRGRLKWYFDAVIQAGVEFAKTSSFEDATRDTLEKPLVPVEDFVEMANLSWAAVGEAPPNLDVAMGRVADITDKPIEVTAAPITKGLAFMKLMRQSFIAEQAKGVDAILEIEFTDLNESNHFIIKDQKCTLQSGASDSFTTKIITPYDTWQQVSNGEISGSKAMMHGLYKIKGDFNFMMSMNKFFGSGEAPTKDTTNQPEKVKKILGVNLEAWMSISFMPWILSWIFIGNSALLGIIIPLLITACIIAIKHHHNEITYFERMSVIYFSVITVMYLVGISLVGSNGPLINYLAMAIFWASSLLDKITLTADYSKHGYDAPMHDNLIFTRTNAILTAFWSVVFIIQGALFIMLRSLDLLSFSPCLFILSGLALVFTKWFSSWYPRYIATGNQVKKEII